MTVRSFSMQARHDGEEDEKEGIGLSARVEQCLSLMHENALMSQQVQVADTGKAVFIMSQCGAAHHDHVHLVCIALGSILPQGRIEPRAMQSRDKGRVNLAVIP